MRRRGSKDFRWDCGVEEDAGRGTGQEHWDHRSVTAPPLSSPCFRFTFIVVLFRFSPTYTPPSCHPRSQYGALPSSRRHPILLSPHSPKQHPTGLPPVIPSTRPRLPSPHSLSSLYGSPHTHNTRMASRATENEGSVCGRSFEMSGVGGLG